MSATRQCVARLVRSEIVSRRLSRLLGVSVVGAVAAFASVVAMHPVAEVQAGLVPPVSSIQPLPPSSAAPPPPPPPSVPGTVEPAPPPQPVPAGPPPAVAAPSPQPSAEPEPETRPEQVGPDDQPVAQPPAVPPPPTSTPVGPTPTTAVPTPTTTAPTPPTTAAPTPKNPAKGLPDADDIAERGICLYEHDGGVFQRPCPPTGRTN